MFSKRSGKSGLGSGVLARWYDRTNRRDMVHVIRHARRVAGLVRPGGELLDIASGPGFLSIELAKRGLKVTGVEISERWIEIARKNAAKAGVNPEFRLGDLTALPVASGSMDFVVCRAAFKSFAEPVKAMQEMRRVLRPGGTALLLDLRSDVHLNVVRHYVQGLGAGWARRWLMMLVFRKVLVRQAYTLEEIEQMADEAGWVNAEDPAVLDGV